MIKKIAKFFINTIPLWVLILIVFKIYVTNEFATLGRNVKNIDEQTIILTEENEQMQQQIASSSSLLAIGDKAKESGYKEPVKDSVITIGAVPVALNQLR